MAMENVIENPPHKDDRVVRWVGAALSLAGIGVMSYLTYVHFAPESSSVCDISAAVNCSIVNKSIFAELLGVPLSVMGMGYFAVMSWSFCTRRLARRYGTVILLSAFSLTFGLYLSGIEHFWLGTVCLFCETSKVLMAAMLVTAGIGLKRTGERLGPLPVGAAVLVGAAVSAAAYFLQH